MTKYNDLAGSYRLLHRTSVLSIKMGVDSTDTKSLNGIFKQFGPRSGTHQALDLNQDLNCVTFGADFINTVSTLFTFKCSNKMKYRDLG